MFFFFSPNDTGKTVYGFLNFAKESLSEIANEENNISGILDSFYGEGKKNSYTNLFDFAEAEVFSDYLKSIKENESYINSYQSYHQIGFTGRSLELKLTLLHDLWEMIKDSAFAGIDMFNDAKRSLTKKFLAHLNSMLGSLAKIFHFIEPIKEFKECLETGIGLIEEVAP